MTVFRRAMLVPVALIGLVLSPLILSGCAAPWSRDHASTATLTTQQERWWAANAPNAKYVEGKGWQVPGTPGFFDATGRPLTQDAVAATSGATPASTTPTAGAAEDRNSLANVWGSISGQRATSPENATGVPAAGLAPPVIAEPAADLTPEQAQWWRDNRHLARWVPPHGYVIPGVDGHFDSVGHLFPSQKDGSVAAASYQPTTSTPPGAPSTYDPPGGSGSASDGSKDGKPGTMTMWDRMTGRTQHDDDDSSSLWWFTKKEKSEPKAKAAFEAGELAFREKKYTEAEAHYSEAASLWPNSPLQEDALFKRAECLFFADSYPAAFEAYETLLTKYKRSRHLENAVAREFAIGRYWFGMHDYNPHALLQPNLTDKTRPRLDTLGSALKAMEKVRLNDPTGPLADDSLMATATSYFTRERFPEADYHFTLLRREYPKSEHQYQAHVLGVQAKLRIYQGPGYDGTPLKGAQDLIDQTLTQFRQITAEERQRLVDLKEKIVTARAERDWHSAQYYEAKGYNQAARYYYNQMLKDYPNSQVAQLVSKRLSEIQDLPAEPEPRLTWVSAVIPEPHDPKRLTLNPPPASDATIRR